MSFSNNQNMVAISVTASSGSVQISATDSIATACQCRVTNTSTTVSVGVLFGKTGLSAAFPTASTAGGSVLHAVVSPMQTVVVDVPPGTTHVAAIGTAAGPTLTYFAFGNES